MKAVIYARVSSREQKEGFSLEAQTKLIRDYAKRNKIHIEKEFVCVESAKNDSRKIFREMLQFVKDIPDLQIILCEKVDRLLRGDLKDRVFLDDLIQNSDKEVHFIKEGLILGRNSKSAQKLHFDIQTALARHYLNNLSDEVKKSYEAMVEDGRYPHIPPIGYKTKLENHIAVIHEEKAHFIRRIFELVATGTYTERKVAEIAFNEGFRSRSGKRVGKSAIGKILHTHFYYGDFEWKGKLYKGVHPPIISKDLFLKVQEALAPRGKNKSRKHNFTYSALMRCGECGNGITAELQKGHIYYRCTKPNGANSCSQKYTREEEIEDQIQSAIRAIGLNENQVNLLKTILRESHEEESEYHNRSLDALNARYKELKAKLDKLLDAYLEGTVNKEIYDNKSVALNEELTSINTEITKHKDGDKKFIEQIENFWEVCKVAPELYASSRPELKRELLKYVVSNLSLKDKKVEFTYRFPFNELVLHAQTEDWQGRKESNFH